MGAPAGQDREARQGRERARGRRNAMAVQGAEVHLQGGGELGFRVGNGDSGEGSDIFQTRSFSLKIREKEKAIGREMATEKGRGE